MFTISSESATVYKGKIKYRPPAHARVCACVCWHTHFGNSLASVFLYFFPSPLWVVTLDTFACVYSNLMRLMQHIRSSHSSALLPVLWGLSSTLVGLSGSPANGP